MDPALPIAPIIPRPDVRRVTGQRGGSQGGFERAFERQREAAGDADAEAPAATPAPPALQPRRPAGRKTQDGGGHRIDVVV